MSNLTASSRAATVPHAISLRQAATTRLAFVSTHDVQMPDGSPAGQVIVALPVSYGKTKRRRYPLVLMPEGEALIGSAIEMSRGLAATREVRECIVVAMAAEALDATMLATRIEHIAHWCLAHYRVERGQLALFVTDRSLPAAQKLVSDKTAVDRRIVVQGEPRDSLSLPPQGGRRSPTSAAAVTTAIQPTAAVIEAHQRAGASLKLIPEATPEGILIPALIHGLRSFWGTGHAYGSELMPLSKPFVSRAMCMARPLIRGLRALSPKTAAVAEPDRYVLRSQVMDRDFEIFVSLPRDCEPDRARYPALLALDANSTFSTVAETARRMADAQEIEDLIVIGVGTPRREGDLAFGLRRFEELSPPCDTVGFENPLGRFFEAVFSMFGRDVHEGFGGAPGLHRFLSTELLPRLRQSLALDPARLCLLGHSAAGTYAGFSLAQADTPFSQHVVLSPGVAISDTWMLAPQGGLSRHLAGAPAFVAIGGEERENRFNQLAGIPLAADYAQRLADSCDANVEYRCLEGETHTTVFPRAVAQALRSLFGQRAEKIEQHPLENTA